MSVLYHPGKEYIVADALSKLSIGSVTRIEDGKIKLVQEVHQLARLGVHLVDSAKDSIWVWNSLESSLVSEAKEK